MEVWPAMSKYSECQEDFIRSFKIKVIMLYRTIVEAIFSLQKATILEKCSWLLKEK
jgi:hypothetical protein